MIHVFLQNKYYTAAILLMYINLTMCGCYTLREVKKADEKDIKIYKVETIDGKVFEFDDSKAGYATIANNEIVNIKKNSEKETILIINVKKMYTEKFSYYNTAGLIIGSLILTLIIIIETAPDNMGAISI